MSETIKQNTNTPFFGETILHGMPELAYVFSIEEKLLMWNKNVNKVLGYSDEELYLKNIADFIDEPDLEKALDTIARIFKDKKEQTVEYNMKTKTGERIPFIGSGSYVLIDGKEYFIGMAINITRLKDTEKKLVDQISETNYLKELLQAENIYLREEMQSQHDFNEIIGESDSLMHTLYRIEQVAPMDSTVLLEGETGTGKELFAAAIHNKSRRKKKPYIKLNCAALPSTLIESELFGHEKGAFTGALQKQTGRFELANGGTLFLDEVSEIPIELQSKLLRVLQEGEFERIGSARTIKVDVRIIAATNRNLEEQIKKNLFRKDLYYRLNVYPVTIAPLRDRSSDIPLLVEHFVKRFNNKIGKKITRISKKTIKQLQSYSWPGNVRELENIIERAVIISSGSTLTVEPLVNPEFEEKDRLLPFMETERQYIIKVLEKTFWRVEGVDGAARILDMHPETLRSRMRKYGIKRPGVNDTQRNI